MKRFHIVQYEWWDTSDEDKEIAVHIMEQLDQHALDRIDELAFKQDYVEGELVNEINDVEYRGWWKFQFN